MRHFITVPQRGVPPDWMLSTPSETPQPSLLLPSLLLLGSASLLLLAGGLVGISAMLLCRISRYRAARRADRARMALFLVLGRKAEGGVASPRITLCSIPGGKRRS